MTSEAQRLKEKLRAVDASYADRFAAQLDPGIRDRVVALMRRGVPTCQSCEGGAGHAYRRPTIDFLADSEADARTVVDIARSEGMEPTALAKGILLDRGDGTEEVVWSLEFAWPPGGYQRDYHRVLGVELANNAVVVFEDEAIACLMVEDAREFAHRILDACDSQVPSGLENQP